MSETVQTKATATYLSVPLPITDLPMSLAYDGDFIETITVTYAGVVYVQTFTNDGTNITNISQFEPPA